MGNLRPEELRVFTYGHTAGNGTKCAPGIRLSGCNLGTDISSQGMNFSSSIKRGPMGLVQGTRCEGTRHRLCTLVLPSHSESCDVTGCREGQE